MFQWIKRMSRRRRTIIRRGCNGNRLSFETLERRELLSGTENLVTVPDSITATPISDSPLAAAVQPSYDNRIYLSVRDPRFGAVGDGVTDDTAAIQAAANAAHAAGMKLFVPPGTYVVGSQLPGTKINGLVFPGGLQVVGQDATLKMRSNPLNPWTRILTVQWNDAKDSPWTILRGLNFDGNFENQGWKGGFDLQQMKLVHLQGFKQNEPAKAGLLRVRIEDCYFYNSAGDGVYVHHQVQLDMINNRAQALFRGALVLTGNKSVVNVENLVIEPGYYPQGTGKEGQVIRTGIDVEPNAKTDVVHLTMKNVVSPGDLDITLTPGSTARLENVKFGAPYFFFIHDGAELLVENSEIHASAQSLMARVGTSIFINTKFYAAGGVNGFKLEWRDGRDQRLTFVNCEFIGTDQGGSGIYAGVDKRSNNNLLTVDGGKISGFLVAVNHNRGGNWYIKNVLIDTDVAFKLQWVHNPGSGSVNFFYNVIFEGIRLTDRVTTYMQMFSNHRENTITHHDVVLTAKQNVIKLDDRYRSDWGWNEYQGSRRIQGIGDPSVVKTPGFVGDLYEWNGRRWECIGTNDKAARWQERF